VFRIKKLAGGVVLKSFKSFGKIGYRLLLVSLSLMHAVQAYDSGGPLIPEQAACDIRFYDLSVHLDVGSKSISGSLSLIADITAPLSRFVLDLAPEYTVTQVQSIGPSGERSTLPAAHENGRLNIQLEQPLSAGDSVHLEVDYYGQPHEAQMPPWSGGFVWETTPSGKTWLGTACEFEGADIWWPCKDHPSDEPDSMAMHFRIPDHLVCASNGRLESIENHGDGTRTYHWFSSTPINIYNITLNVAPYEIFQDEYICITGDTLPVFLFLLPEYAVHSADFLHEMKRNLDFLESIYGPYPFRIDKYGVAQTSYAGMEHQTVTAYGDRFELNEFGFDYILFHETTHDWWGNMITCADWKDLWLHESFATYTEALYAEHLNGQAALHDYIESNFYPYDDVAPLAPEVPTSFNDIYGFDVYYRGARVLHTLRFLLGDSVFFEVLRKMLYPTPASEFVKIGEQCRSVTSETFIAKAEEISGRDLDWFFDVYLRQPGLPVLQADLSENVLHLQWLTENAVSFAMPVEILTGEDRIRVPMTEGYGELTLTDPDYQTDPDRWILKAEAEQTDIANYQTPVSSSVLYPGFPNPFNSHTEICFKLTGRQPVTLDIFNSRGEHVNCLYQGTLPSGSHRIRWQADAYPSGVYCVVLRTSGFHQSRKLLLLK